MGVPRVNSRLVRDLAAECGFALAGVAAPRPVPDFARFRDWINRGLAGEMRYLNDHRADVRSDPELLLPGVQSIISVGFLYDGPEHYTTDFSDSDCALCLLLTWY